MTTDELIYSVNLKWDKIGFESLDASIKQTVTAFAAATAAAAAASGVIFAMGKNFAETTDNLIKTAGRVNATTSEIQKLTFAAEDNGATMDDVTGSLANLSKAQEELLRGKGDFEAWGRLGVNPKDYQSTSDLLLAVSDSVKDLNSQEAIDLMSRVGISPQLLQTLQNGSDGLKSLGNEFEALGGISTPSMLKASQDFMSGWQRASSMVTGILNKVGAGLLDKTINPAIKAFNKFAKNNMKKIAEVITKIFDGIAKASEFIFSMLNRLSQPFGTLINLMGGLENAAMALAAAIAIIKSRTIMAMLPAIIAVGALYIAFDELMSFLDGKESFLGDIFTKMGISAEDVKVVISSIGDVINMVIKGWSLMFTQGGDALEGLGILIDRYLINPIKEALEYIEKITSFLSKPIKASFDFASDTLEGAKNFLGFGESNTPAPATVNNSNNISIQVDGAGNPVAVGEEVRRVLNEEMNKSAQRAGY